MEQLHGILIIDKPGGMSSAQCVGRIKRLGQKKILTFVIFPDFL